MRRILVVDDDREVVRLIRAYLEQAGFEVLVAYDGDTAVHVIRRDRPDLLLLDLMLPGKDGWEITRLVRGDPALAHTPIIMLTARVDDTDKIIGLELGADDYVTKPFSPGELVSRVKAVLRRVARPAEGGDAPIDHGALRLDPLTREVIVRGRPVELTATEFNLLWFLAAHPRQVFRRDKLLEEVWGYADYLDPGTVTVHIRRLREKIERDPAKPAWLQTVWGVGYKFEPGAE